MDCRRGLECPGSGFSQAQMAPREEELAKEKLKGVMLCSHRIRTCLPFTFTRIVPRIPGLSRGDR
jgi:hypothetical protein